MDTLANIEFPWTIELLSLLLLSTGEVWCTTFVHLMGGGGPLGPACALQQSKSPWGMLHLDILCAAAEVGEAFAK